MAQLTGVRIGIVTFPGTLDQDAVGRAIRLGGGEAVDLWHADPDLNRVDAVVLPGGATYGNYLRAGAIASLAPLMAQIIDASNGGLPVLGVANGFQVLTEARLLPGSLDKNTSLAFNCSEQSLTVENAKTAWTREFSAGDKITLPFKNEHGRFTAPEAVLDQLEGEGRVVLRYRHENPTGSDRGIAGVTNAAGNVVGLMPHPEYAIEAGFGPDSPKGNRAGTDGLRFFRSVIGALSN